jgi:hypothetical protein
VKKKARLSHLNATKTGGGPSSQQDLLPLEERLLALLTPVVIAGIPEIGEAGLGIDIIAPPNDLEISFEDLVSLLLLLFYYWTKCNVIKIVASCC